jgi:DNA-binding NarL/FixJ family response regulator
VLRVVVIDDHVTLAELLALALRDETDLDLVGHAATAAAGLALVAELRPDIVVMDYRLPDMDGVLATSRVLAEHPSARVVMMTACTEPNLIVRAAAAGAAAFLHKSGVLAEVLTAIRTARNGKMVVDTRLLGAVLDAPTATPLPGPRLTPREGEVLQLLGCGLDVTRAARTLGLSVHTCRGHVKSVLAKFACHTQLEAVATATRLGMINRPDRPSSSPPQPRIWQS